jgi:hypothetical protein
MNAKDCREARLEIDQSELGQPASEPVEAHLVACASCRQFQEERSRLRSLVGSLAPVAAPADFEMRLRARIARENDRPRQPFIFRFVISTPAIAVAALLVMIVGAVVWTNQRHQPETVNSASSASSNKEAAVAKDSAPAPVDNGNKRANESDALVAADNPKRTNSARNTKPAFAVNAPGPASDFNVSSAQSVRMTPDRAGEVSLTAPMNPMVVSVKDDHGGTRRILLPPVSFGSQRLTDNRTPVSMNNSRDW